MMSASRRAHPADYLVTIIFILLVVFGLVMLASASSNLGLKQFGDPYYFLKHQLYYGVSLGLIGFLLTSRLYYGVYNSKHFSMIFLAITIVLLLLVFTSLGLSAKGATRWLELGPFSFQPAELLKLSLIMYLASWLAYK